MTLSKSQSKMIKQNIKAYEGIIDQYNKSSITTKEMFESIPKEELTHMITFLNIFYNSSGVFKEQYGEKEFIVSAVKLVYILYNHKVGGAMTLYRENSDDDDDEALVEYEGNSKKAKKYFHWVISLFIILFFLNSIWNHLEELNRELGKVTSKEYFARFVENTVSERTEQLFNKITEKMVKTGVMKPDTDPDKLLSIKASDIDTQSLALLSNTNIAPIETSLYGNFDNILTFSESLWQVYQIGIKSNSNALEALTDLSMKSAELANGCSDLATKIAKDQFEKYKGEYIKMAEQAKKPVVGSMITDTIANAALRLSGVGAMYSGTSNILAQQGNIIQSEFAIYLRDINSLVQNRVQGELSLFQQNINRIIPQIMNCLYILAVVIAQAFGISKIFFGPGNRPAIRDRRASQKKKSSKKKRSKKKSKKSKKKSS